MAGRNSGTRGDTKLPALAETSYHVLAPDMRGYGSNDGSGPMEAYVIQKLVVDVTGLIDAIGAEMATIVAHD